MSINEMTEILDELEDIAGWFITRGDQINAKFLRDLKSRFADMDSRLAVVNQQMTTVLTTDDARCPGQEWEPFGIQPQCMGCARQQTEDDGSSEWIEAPTGDPCPQRLSPPGAQPSDEWKPGATVRVNAERIEVFSPEAKAALGVALNRPNDPHDDLTPGADPTDRVGVKGPDHG
jgi:hypothetical protein